MSSYVGISSENLIVSFNSIVQNCSLYSLSNTQYALQLDGQQTYGISFIAAERIVILCQQLSPIAPAWISTAGAIVALAGTFSLVSQIIVSQMEGLCNEIKRSPEGISFRGWTKHDLADYIWWFDKVKDLSRLIVQGFQNSDRLINVASLVSYAALCALGHPIEGVSGFVGMGLVTLKRNAQLPALVDHYLQPVVNMARIIYGFTQSTFFVFRIGSILSGLSQVYSILSTSWLAKSILPAKILNPLLGLHCYERLTQSYQELIVKQRKWLTDSGLGAERFSIIPTYVHADRVNEVLPPDYLSQINDIDVNQIFNDLDAAIEKLKTDSREWRKDTVTDKWQTWAQAWEEAQSAPSEGGDVAYMSGYEMIKIAATTGRVADVLPPDVGLFQLVIKALAHSMLHDKDEDNLKTKLIDFQRIGKQCAERWTSEVQFLLNPNTKDLGWAVHNELAKMRGALLQGIMTSIIAGIKNANDINNPELSANIKTLLDITGGANGTHVLNSFHDAFRSIVRTYEGEVRAQLHPYSLWGSLFQMYFGLNEYVSGGISFPDQSTPTSELLNIFGRGWLIGTSAAISHPASGQLTLLPYIIYPAFQQHFDKPESLVSCIYDAIYPQLVFDEKSRKFEERRKIQWESVQTWMNNFVTNLPDSEDENLDPAVDFQAHYFENIELGGNVDIKGSGKTVPTLTREGVRLMLWDMGILKRHPKENYDYIYKESGRPLERLVK